ncbi:GNAT family N-acetyltransferase [Bacillus sp. FSL W8-0102]|uniref:GNAT family N-acetyltransferase n=1 Tax=Bacillus sp. FSL W8-0102 TaxID=2978205 RepID=UPI0030F5B6B0
MIKPIKDVRKEFILKFFKEQWGSTEMVTSSGTYDCLELDGFVSLNLKGEINGFITFYISKDECEIISLDSMEENKGIGTSLLNRVEFFAKEQNCKKMKLITTNDNLRAIRFYQKRGYQCVKVIPNAVNIARKRKPEIPLMNPENHIPIRDEFLFVKEIQ